MSVKTRSVQILEDVTRNYPNAGPAVMNDVRKLVKDMTDLGSMCHFAYGKTARVPRNSFRG